MLSAAETDAVRLNKSEVGVEVTGEEGEVEVGIETENAFVYLCNCHPYYITEPIYPTLKFPRLTPLRTRLIAYVKFSSHTSRQGIARLP